jgi:hypothetical protein
LQFGTFCWHLVFFPGFGKLYGEKSGNPVPSSSKNWNSTETQFRSSKSSRAIVELKALSRVARWLASNQKKAPLRVYIGGHWNGKCRHSLCSFGFYVLLVYFPSFCYIFLPFGMFSFLFLPFTAFLVFLLPFGIFYGHSVYFAVLWYVLRRKIWQPWPRGQFLKWAFTPTGKIRSYLKLAPRHT